jgi:Tol biopolymer transport system component
VPDDNNGFHDIFVYDRVLKTIKRVSISSTGGQANGDSYSPSISADGRYVAFSLQDIRPAGAPMGVDLPPDYSYFISQVLVHDRISKTTRVVSISSTGDLGNGNSGGPSINADGSAVAFSSLGRQPGCK